jgi:hypothetical protein
VTVRLHPDRCIDQDSDREMGERARESKGARERDWKSRSWRVSRERETDRDR